LLATLAAQDRHRSQVLRAIEGTAACTAQAIASIQNYFQGEAAQLRRRR
jgi:ABC-type transporter Mla subunit MlaD